MANFNIDVNASIDPTAKSTGGNEATDAGKLLEFNAEGQIQGSADSSSLAAVKGTASGSAYGVQGESVNGYGGIFSSTNSDGLNASSIGAHAISAINFDATDEPLHVKNANAANTADLATFRRNNNQGLNIKNDGGLEWTTATGAGTTKTSLGIGTAAEKDISFFDTAGSAAAAQAFAIQRGNHTGTQTASTISDFATAVGALFTTVGNALRQLVNPSAVSFIRINADNTVTARSASELRTDLSLGTAAQVNTGTGSGDVPTTSQADARYALKNTSVDTVAILPPSLVDWVNMPSALAFFAGQNRWVVPMDLSAKTECKLHVTMGSVAGAAGSKIRLLYRTQSAGYSVTIGDYSTIGTSEVQVTIGTSTNALVSTAWIPLAAGAKDNIIVAVAGLDGDGAADPRFLNIYLETR